jgi:hypothetical protein
LATSAEETAPAFLCGGKAAKVKDYSDRGREAGIARGCGTQMILHDQTAASFDHQRFEGRLGSETLSMQYTITAAFLLAVVMGSLTAAILGGYGLMQLIASGL